MSRSTSKNNTNRKSGYAHFRYKKRVDDDDDESLDSESSYGEDSDDSDDGESADWKRRLKSVSRNMEERAY